MSITETRPEQERLTAMLIFLLWALCCTAKPASALATRNIVLITLDGMRWQEVFSGADENLLINQRYVANPAELKERFWAQDPAVRRSILMPFLWSRIKDQGQIYGNRNLDNRVEVRNRIRLSYSGYSELLVGYPDDKNITRNRKRYNPNVTILEYANRHPELQGRVASFASWYLFPWIINEPRAGFPVNAGFREAGTHPLSAKEIFLNSLQRQVPSPWRGVRLDAFTYQYALEYLRKRQPRLLYIAFGETDEFAHEGHYDNYLLAAQRNDTMIRELWQWLQLQPGYRNQTTMLITTDHGRGRGHDWRHHGADIKGSEATWLAVIGPDSSPLGEVSSDTTLTMDRLAATIGALLGIDLPAHKPTTGKPIRSILE